MCRVGAASPPLLAEVMLTDEWALHKWDGVSLASAQLACSGWAGQESCPLFDRWGNPHLPKHRASMWRGWGWSLCSGAPCVLLLLLQWLLPWLCALGIFYAVGFLWQRLLRGYHPHFSGLLRGQGQGQDCTAHPAPFHCVEEAAGLLAWPRVMVSGQNTGPMEGPLTCCVAWAHPVSL